MTKLTGKFTQTPSEVRRYILNYTLTTADGEDIASMAVPVVTQTYGKLTVVPFVINNVMIAPDGKQVVFYAHGGDDGTEYEIQFLATTTVAQILEDVVQFNIDGDL